MEISEIQGIRPGMQCNAWDLTIRYSMSKSEISDTDGKLDRIGTANNRTDRLKLRKNTEHCIPIDIRSKIATEIIQGFSYVRVSYTLKNRCFLSNHWVNSRKLKFCALN